MIFLKILNSGKVLEVKMQLNQKESMLLEDMKSQEKLCIEKYAKSAAAAKDSGLSQIFKRLGEIEQGHLTQLNEIGSGRVPTASGAVQLPTVNVFYTSESPDKQQDKFLCGDLLATEKHASSLYDTCVFEFRDKPVRDVLNRIQRDEQEHGKVIYDYMKANGMYS
jgi:rubrerythrin